MYSFVFILSLGGKYKVKNLRLIFVLSNNYLPFYWKTSRPMTHLMISKATLMGTSNSRAMST